MILSAYSIEKALKDGIWSCNKPISDLHIGPNSLDVTLSDEILVPKSLGIINPKNYYAELYTRKKIDKLQLMPKQFVLGSVNEAINCTNALFIDGQHRYFIQCFDGRSTIARLGLSMHVSAGYGDYGFSGSFTTEMFNNANWTIELDVGSRIGQIYFMEVDAGVTNKMYRGYDQKDCKPFGPRMGKGRV